jgi:quercetin dioxygenase-like cupin family protein
VSEESTQPGRDDQHVGGEDETPGMVVLAELADTLMADLPNHPAGRTAKTVLSGTEMRAVVIALKEGSELNEHDSPAAATLFVIKGKVTLRSGEHAWPVYAGQLIPIPPQRHSVEAHADSAFLLTVALH